MKLEKLSKKVLGRKMSLFEIYSVMSGIIIALVTIFKGNGNYVPLIFGFSILILIGVFIKNKQKNMVLLSMISLLGWLLILNVAAPTLLTTTFSSGLNDVPPSTLLECQAINGIALPLNLECSLNHVETKGNAGEGFICCILDDCDGTWKRVWNSETKIYEKICDGE